MPITGTRGAGPPAVSSHCGKVTNYFNIVGEQDRESWGPRDSDLEQSVRRDIDGGVIVLQKSRGGFPTDPQADWP